MRVLDKGRLCVGRGGGGLGRVGGQALTLRRALVGGHRRRGCVGRDIGGRMLGAMFAGVGWRRLAAVKAGLTLAAGGRGARARASHSARRRDRRRHPGGSPVPMSVVGRVSASAAAEWAGGRPRRQRR